MVNVYTMSPFERLDLIVGINSRKAKWNTKQQCKTKVWILCDLQTPIHNNQTLNLSFSDLPDTKTLNVACR